MATAKKDKATIIDQATPEDTAPERSAEGQQPNALTEQEMFREGSHWYVVHTYSGYEDKVQTNLEHRITTMDAQDLVFRVVIPSVNEIEIRDGQRRTVPKKILPGYVLVQMIELADEKEASPEQVERSSRAWLVVRNTPGVTGFVGSGNQPTPLDDAEVRSILSQMRAEEPKIKIGFEIGQSVRIIDGPFQDFIGIVDEIELEKGKVKLLVSFFGRDTPVELDFLQVEKV